MGTIDIVTFLLSMLYILLAIRNNYLCFYVAIVQCTLWTYLDFFRYHLVFDGILQIFYIGMAVWGIILWHKKDENESNLPITFLNKHQHYWTIIGGGILAMVLAYGSEFMMEAEMRYLDAFTTIISILATFMLIFRKVDTWLYFVLADALYIYIYIQAESIMLALVMVIYTVMAIIGYIKWKKMMLLS